MLRTVFLYEWLRIFRSIRAFLIPCAVLMGAFAAWEGAGWKRFQEQALAKASALEAVQRSRLLSDARAADTGAGPVSLGSPLHGVSQYWTRRYAGLAPGPLAALAVGQSDLEPYYSVFSGAEPNVLLFPEEIRNPMGLLHGRWDARFLVVLLLPLLVIALGFDLAAEERETGTLRLLGAGARSLPGYFFLRAAFHLLLAWGAGLGGFLLALAFADGAAFTAPTARPGLLLFGLGSLAYLAFWSALCLGANALRKSAGFNLAALILIWAAMAFLLPTGLDRLAGLRHPLPSRPAQALTLRALESVSATMREERVERLRLDRPELFDSTRARGRPAAPLLWYQGFLAEQAFLGKVRDSLESGIMDARENQEAWSAALRNLVPTLAMEDFILTLAGRDPAVPRRFSRDLEAYRSGVREAIWPNLIQARAFSAGEIASLPRWRAGVAAVQGPAASGAPIAVVLPTVALLILSWPLLRRPA